MSYEDIAQREAEALRTASEMYHAFHGAPLPALEEEEEDEQENSAPGESGGADAEESAGGNRARRSR